MANLDDFYPGRRVMLRDILNRTSISVKDPYIATVQGIDERGFVQVKYQHSDVFNRGVVYSYRPEGLEVEYA